MPRRMLPAPFGKLRTGVAGPDRGEEDGGGAWAGVPFRKPAVGRMLVCRGTCLSLIAEVGRE